MNTSQEPNLQKSSEKADLVEISFISGLLMRKLVLLLSVSLGIFSPFFAYAGFLSIFSDLFGPKVEAVGETTPSTNSQNMVLLQAALNPNPNPSKGGGEIMVVGGTALLPESGPTGTLADVEASQNNGQISIYVVHKGDTLTDIAKMFGVSVNTVIWGNDLRSSIIREGQTLIILPVSGVRHIVKTSDTLPSIAKLYKGDLREIMQFNDLPADAKLAVGDVVIVPDGEIISSPGISGVRQGGGPLYEGYYGRPLLGGKKTQGIHGYNGVDLGAPYGTPVYAAAAGDAIISRNFGWNGGYGIYIVISHSNGTQTLYSHLSDAIVFQGARVYKGQLIGYVGSSGKSTGPHLHFEVRGAVNPF